MARVPTSILLDEGLKQKAKKMGLSISKYVEECLIDYISTREVYEDSIPALLEEEIVKFAEIARDRDDWEKFAIGRCSVIRSKTGLVIQPHKLIHHVNKRLKEVV